MGPSSQRAASAAVPTQPITNGPIATTGRRLTAIPIRRRTAQATSTVSTSTVSSQASAAPRAPQWGVSSRFAPTQVASAADLLSSWRALPPPPSVLRYLDSDDVDDRRLATMLAARWREHAMAALADDAQRHAFLAHHAALFARVGVPA